MEFAVTCEGILEGKPVWVLAIDAQGERFLICDPEARFIWLPMADCKLERVATPEQPRLVMVVQPQAAQAGPGIVIPGTFDNRAARRNGNGHQN